MELIVQMESGYTTELDVANEPMNSDSTCAPPNLNTKPIRGHGKATLLREEEQQRAGDVYSNIVLPVNLSYRTVNRPSI